jgi:hypothetical protein
MGGQTRKPRGVLIGGLLIGSLTATGCATAGTISDDKVVRWVETTVAERQPRAEDKRFDEIAWVSDIRAAIKLAQEHHRPIYLLTVDGRVNTGRC